MLLLPCHKQPHNAQQLLSDTLDSEGLANVLFDFAAAVQDAFDCDVNVLSKA